MCVCVCVCVSFYDVAKQPLLEMALWAAPPLIHTSHQTTTLPFIPPSLPLLSSHSFIWPPSILCPLIWTCGNMRGDGHTGPNTSLLLWKKSQVMDVKKERLNKIMQNLKKKVESLCFV